MNFFDHMRSYCDLNLLYHSRCHALKSFGPEAYVKREDESGFGISGPKKRKYASLLPFLLHQGFEEVLLIGGERSNHIASFLQLLNEKGLKSRLLLKEGHSPGLVGNALLSRLLASSEQHIRISKEDWPSVENRAQEMAKKSALKTFIVPEGGSCAAALPGACSLWEDIERNEQGIGKQFSHVWIDSGTAFTAIALVLAQYLAGREVQVHVVLTAGDETYFQGQFSIMQQWMRSFWPMAGAPPMPTLYAPISARSFGSVNAEILKSSIRMAREEGILCDPIYTAKLFLTAQKELLRNTYDGTSLIIHTGGGSGLLGFGEKYARSGIV